MAKQYKSIPGAIFDGLNYTFLGVFALCTVLPFIYVIAGSFASDAELTGRAFFLIPETFSLSGYKFIFSSDTLFKSIGVSVYVTVVGTLVNLLFTVTMAYPLARRDLMGRSTVLNLVVFSMLFSGGMIPTYLVVKSLGSLDSFWALMLPGAISAFNLIVVKNFFQELPPGLEESAKIDGSLGNRRAVAYRPAAVQAGPCHVRPVLRRRALEQFFHRAAVHQRPGQMAAAGHAPANRAALAGFDRRRITARP
ncbi:carbohydrate ABC transporter permease [Paenibacillus sp. P25]|nr:carbohydrate ABC transporter permease [Paenibacillus sp. P25]